MFYGINLEYFSKLSMNLCFFSSIIIGLYMFVFFILMQRYLKSSYEFSSGKYYTYDYRSKFLIIFFYLLLFIFYGCLLYYSIQITIFYNLSFKRPSFFLINTLCVYYKFDSVFIIVLVYLLTIYNTIFYVCFFKYLRSFYYTGAGLYMYWFLNGIHFILIYINGSNILFYLIFFFFLIFVFLTVGNTTLENSPNFKGFSQFLDNRHVSEKDALKVNSMMKKGVVSKVPRNDMKNKF